MRKKATAPDGDAINNGEQRQGDAQRVQPKVIHLPWPKIFLGLTVIATIVGALLATKTLAGIDKNIAAAKEAARPANVTLTKITTPNCSDCFNLNDALASLKKQNVSVGEEKALSFDSSEAQSLIKQFGIKKVPTYILTGEVTKHNFENFTKSNGEIKQNTFVFTQVTPFFIDPTTKREMGKVTATVLTDPSCTQCIDPKLTLEAYKKAGIKIVDEKEVIWNSAEGQALISQYNITKVPTFLFSPDIDLYDIVKNTWSRIGTVEQDKTYVARNLFLPYRDLEKGQLLGLVGLVYLTDSTCTDCYKPEVTQKNILTRGFGIGLASERTVDVNSGEGQSLVSQYKITKVPTILLSPDVDQYVAIKNAWKNVGTVESDGWYVFTQMQQLGNITYKDLTNNQVINPAQPSVSPSPTGASK